MVNGKLMAVEDYQELGMRALDYLMNGRDEGGRMGADELSRHLGLRNFHEWISSLEWMNANGLMHFKGMQDIRNAEFSWSVTPLGKAKLEVWRLQRDYPPLDDEERETISKLAMSSKRYLLVLAGSANGTYTHEQVASFGHFLPEEVEGARSQLRQLNYIYTNALHTMLTPEGTLAAKLVTRNVIDERGDEIATPTGETLTEKLLCQLAWMGSQPPLRLLPIHHSVSEDIPRQSAHLPPMPEQAESAFTPPRMVEPQSSSQNNIGNIHTTAPITINTHHHHGSTTPEKAKSRLKRLLDVANLIKILVGTAILILGWFGYKTLHH